MVEPVALADFFLSFFSGAMIILIATLYAGLFAWAKLKQNAALIRWQWFVYGLLLCCILVFAKVMHLTGEWFVLVLLMALGYAGMPRLIWSLCVATHTGEENH